MGKCINYDIPRRRREEFLVCRQREEGKGGGYCIWQIEEKSGVWAVGAREGSNAI